MKFILLIIFTGGLISCSGRSNGPDLRGKWINLNVCKPNDILLYDFSNDKLTTLEGNVYNFKVSPQAITIQFDSVVSIPFTTIIAEGDTLNIIIDDENKLSLLKFRAYPVMDNFANGHLYGISFETEYSRKWKIHWNFLNEDRIVVTEVNVASNDTITNVYPFHEYTVEGISILQLSNIFCNTYLLATKSNDTIQAFTAYNNKVYPCKIFRHKGAIKVKASPETLIGFWKVIRCSDPEAKNFVSLRFSQDELNIGGMYSGIYTSRYSLDILGRIVLGNFDNFELNRIEIDDIKKDKLVVTVNGVKYILVRH